MKLKKKIQSPHVIALILLACLSAYFLKATVISDIFGWSLCAAGSKYFHCIQTGDGDGAIFWAERYLSIIKKDRMKYYRGPNGPIIDKKYLAYAQELRGVCLEEPLEYFQQHPEFDSTANRARLLYKLQRKQEAFKEYCRFFEEKYPNTLENSQYDYGRTNIMDNVYGHVMCSEPCAGIENSLHFRPFMRYSDFYRFMKDEYEKAGEPEEYSDMMKLFETVYRKHEYEQKQLH